MPDETSSTLDRRKFLTVLGAGSGALALNGCSTSNVERLVPYLVQSEDQIPGVATWYASTCTECSAGCGVHVRTREGRADQARGESRAPDQQGERSARAARRHCRDSTIRAGSRARWCGIADGTFKPTTWDDAIARVAAKVSRWQACRDFRRRSRHVLRSSRRVDRGPRRTCRALRAVRSRAAASGQPEGVRRGSAAGARLRQGQVHHFFRGRLSRHVARPGREPARLRRVARVFARCRRPGWYTSALGWISPASTPTNGCRSPRAPKRRLRSRWPPWSRPSVKDNTRSPRRSRATPPRRQPRKPAFPRRRSKSSRRSLPRPNRALRWPVESALSTAAPSSCAWRSTFSTTSRATSVRRSTSASTSPRATDMRHSVSWRPRWMAARWACSSCTTPIRSTPFPRRVASPRG